MPWRGRVRITGPKEASSHIILYVTAEEDGRDHPMRLSLQLKGARLVPDSIMKTRIIDGRRIIDEEGKEAVVMVVMGMHARRRVRSWSRNGLRNGA